jgi:RNA-splicing ligase RtcB
MKLCQEYAVLNRNTMAQIILFGLGITNFLGSWTTIHNYIDIPSRTIRKGAISAKNNEKVLIPMNMRDGSLICVGKGHPDWLFSAPHGAGRIMSRIQAKKELKMEDFENSMNGIYTTSVCEQTIDEAPMVYKDSKQIMEDIVPTVEVLKIIKPLYNFKARQ